MVKINAKHILLYVIGVALFLFGYPSFWTKIKESNEKEKLAQKLRDEAMAESTKGFDTQTLTFDSIANKWENKSVYFQTIYLGKIDFKSLQSASKQTSIASSISKKVTVETNDDENASESA